MKAKKTTKDMNKTMVRVPVWLRNRAKVSAAVRNEKLEEFVERVLAAAVEKDSDR